jgi:hypothetical protein
MMPLLESEIADVPELSDERPGRKLTLRSPDELLAMEFDDSDIILGDRLIAKGQPVVIAAPGGSGKSRLVLQMIAATISGRPWVGFKTGAKDLKWLILQTENSNRRLKQDLQSIRNWLGEDDWLRFNNQVVIHTLENDDDGFVSLDSPENQQAIQSAIESGNFNVIVIDPLNDFSAGDPNKDADMKNTLQILSRICRRGNPERAIVVLHHAITGKSGAAKAVGHDRTSFARNSKTLHAWTRGQINIVPIDPDNNDRLVVACGKCSNGKEFAPFGIKLNTETMIYSVDDSFDMTAWAEEITGKKDAPDMTPERVRELCAVAGMPKAMLAKAIEADCGCVRQSAYRYIKRATNKTIRVGKDELYFKR